MLLRDLTIENYRSFENYKLDGLARVNLLVGDNNCGKTSVLEAVRLFVTNGSMIVLRDQLEHRGDIALVVSKEAGRARSSFGIGSAFHDSLADIDIRNVPPIRLIGTDVRQRELTIRVKEKGSELTVVAEVDGQLSDRDFPMFSIDQSGRTTSDTPEVKFRSGPSPGTHGPPNAFVPSEGLTISELVEAWNSLLRNQREDVPETVVRLVDPTVKKILFSADTQHRRDILIDCNRGRITAAQVGDGEMFALSLGCALAYCSHGVLLVDEIDTGLHYSKLSDMWRMVIKAAAELDVQVFATTHSLDCIRALEAACEQDETLRDEVALFSIDRRMDEAVRYGGDELSVVVTHEIEVR